MKLAVRLFVFTPVGHLAVGILVESNFTIVQSRGIVTLDIVLISLTVERVRTAHFPRSTPHNLNEKEPIAA